MSADPTTEGALEIAHVLFIDAVGYSKLGVPEQRELLDELNQVVRNTPQFRAAEASGKLIRLPTGDGMALVFLENPEAPVQCAVEINKAVRENPRLPLRMGIHSGPVSRVLDVNDRWNAAGAGINTAQRVMSCGDADHILLSRRVSDDLVEHRNWRPYLHDIGECEVKHGARIGLVNLYGDGIGNPNLPAICQEHARAQLHKTRKTRRTLLLGAAALAALITCVTLFALKQTRSNKKSIAVLPFVDLSDDQQNIHLCEGIHDEILTDLAKVADLKVISRTSVMQYRTDTKHSVREIGRQLGVANIVEGTVKRVGNQVRVIAQLIDARTDTHISAERFDGDLADVFKLESSLAEKIVAHLRSKLSPAEKAAIEERPTADFDAYDLYVRGKLLVDQAVFNLAKQNLLEAVQLLDQAVQRDPSFVGAYYQLAHAHDQLFVRGFDHTETRLGLARAAIDSIRRLQPESGEAHLALAKHLYWGYRDYDRARDELVLAQRKLPNDPITFLLLGYINRRQGLWEQSLSNMQSALELDPQNPQNVFILEQIAKTYECLRNYAAAETTLKRALTIDGRNAVLRVHLARLDLDARADPRPLRSTLKTLVLENPENAALFANQSITSALCERDFEAAAAALTVLTADGCYDEAVLFPRGWCEGQVARARGDSGAAQKAFAAARVELEGTVRNQPENGPALCALGVIDAALGRKAEAIEEGRRAVALLPVEKDSINGALLQQYLAIIYAWTGETNLACEQLSAGAKLPGYLSYGQLRLDPIWEPIRSDARFQKVMVFLAPK